MEADRAGPDQVTALLRTRYPDATVTTCRSVRVSTWGDQSASTADRVDLEVTYAKPDARLPRRLILKTVLSSPRAPAAMYENEVRFYAEIRDDLHIETPLVFGTFFDAGSGRFDVLLEDLNQRGARFLDTTQPVSVRTVESLIDHLATLHGTFWQSPRFGRDLSWVPTPTTGGMFEVFDSIGLELIADQVGKYTLKQELIDSLGTSLDELWSALWTAQRELTEEPTTLLHGDPHVGNTYVLPDGSAGFLDWQLMVRGQWAHDVVYLLATSLSTDDRREHQDELLNRYLRGLEIAGVPDVPDPDDAWMQLRRSCLWGLVIGWLITPPENYGPAITDENLRRVAAVVGDYRPFELL